MQILVFCTHTHWFVLFLFSRLVASIGIAPRTLSVPVISVNDFSFRSRLISKYYDSLSSEYRRRTSSWKVVCPNHTYGIWRCVTSFRGNFLNSTTAALSNFIWPWIPFALKNVTDYLIKFLLMNLTNKTTKQVSIIYVTQGHEVKILFNCTYLETKIVFDLQEKWSLNTNMTHICVLNMKSVSYFLRNFFYFNFILESWILKSDAAFLIFLYFVFVAA
jgi:hypothetical protein